MIANDTLLAGFKANERKIKAKLVFNYATPVTLTNSSIVTLNYDAKGTLELGCLEDVVVTLVLKGDALTDAQFNTDVEVEILFGLNNTYVSVGKYKSQRWGRKNSTILLELGNRVSVKQQINEMVSKTNISLNTFISNAITSMMGETASINTGAADATLDSAYMYYKTIIEQLKAFAFATNSVVSLSDGVKFKPYKLTTTACDTLTEGTGGLILDVSKTSDYIQKLVDVEILTSFFNKSECESLFSTEVDVTSEYLNIDFNFPVFIRGLNFPAQMQLGYFIPKVFGLKVRVVGTWYSSYRMQILGSKITSTIKGQTGDDDVTYLSNPYIQNDSQVTALDKSIYNAVQYKIPYRGCPLYQVGDVLTVAGVGNMLVTRQQLKFDGGLSGTLEGVIAND